MAYSFLDLAEDVLKRAKNPLTFQQIWEQAESSGLAAKLKTKGKTPWNSMGALLYVDVRDTPTRSSSKSANVQRVSSCAAARVRSLRPSFKELR